MRLFTRLLLFSLLLPIVFSLPGCNSDAKKLEEKDKELADLRQVIDMEKREMENDYSDFVAQYGEMKQTIKNDSLVARLDQEQKRAEQLLQELRTLKSSSAAEILRLKKELATVRAVLRSYIRQVDSLQQINQALTGERDAARADAQRTREENTAITQQNTSLNEKVAIAAQLNATSISLSAKKKNGKDARKVKDISSFQIAFTIARNVTARTGNRTVYARVLKPSGEVLGRTATFQYQGRTLESTAQKLIEYNGEELRITLFAPVNEHLSAGSYTVHIFCDGQMIGQGSASVR